MMNLFQLNKRFETTYYQLSFQIIPIVLMAIIGFLVSVIISFNLQDNEKERVQLQFEQTALGRFERIHDSINNMLIELEDVAGLFAASEKVEWHEFQRFVQPQLKRHSAFQAIEWIPRVENAERAKFEQQAQQIFPGFQITERQTQGKMISAGQRAEYFPVYYVEPYIGNEAALGFDLASNPTRLTALLKARDTGKMVVTARITLVQEAGNQNGFLIFKPIYRNYRPIKTKKQRRTHLLGFILGVFRMNELVQNSLNRLVSDGINFYIFDNFAPLEKRFLYSYGSHSQKNPSSQTDSENVILPAGINFSTSLNIADSEWLVHFFPAPGYFTKKSWQPILFLFSGLLLTFLSTGYLFTLVRRNMIINQLVEERTQELHRSEERFELALRGANDGLWDWNLETNTVYYSHRWKQMLGFDDNELHNSLNEWQKRLHPEDIDSVMLEIEGYLGKKIPTYENIVRLKHKEGYYIWILMRGIAVWNELTGKAIRFIGTNVDITAQKDIEIELQNAKKAAEAANHAKNEFLANMSHELRTPLNGILGYTQILNRDETLTKPQREGINIIHRSGEHLLMLINDILDLSKIEADKLVLQPTDFYFSEFLQEIVELMNLSAQQKGLAFMYKPLSVLPLAVHADDKKLRQILLNLLSNAIKFTQKGGVYLKVHYENGKAWFIVEDTGRGIETEKLSEIFMPFRQVGYQSRQTEGTGLGLSISKRLVELMGGQLQVESLIDKGSSFWFGIDLAEVEGFIDPRKKPQPIIVGYQINEPLLFENREKLKILVVDDRKENRSLLVHLLTPLGFEVLEAKNGQQGLTLANDFLPDVIMTDLVMPVMDGFELGRQIRQSPRLKHIPIIANSASVFDTYKQQSLQAGCDVFIEKPIQMSILLEYLQKCLPLEWVYEVKKTLNLTENQSTSSIADLVGPSLEQANILFDYMIIGNLRKTIATAKQFAQQNNQLIPFAETVEHLAQNYQISELETLIKKFINE